MEGHISLPTDNVFKFYALFGLFLIIFSIGSTLYVTKLTNDLIFKNYVSYESIKAESKRTVAQQALYKVLKRKLEIAGEDKDFDMKALSVLLAIGTIMMIFGFYKWHTGVQVVQDEMARLNLKKLKIEMGEDEST